MKKILCVILLAVTIPMTLACDEYYTEIHIVNNGWTYSIDLPAQSLNEQTPYEIIYTDDGCDVIIHFNNNQTK